MTIADDVLLWDRIYRQGDCSAGIQELHEQIGDILCIAIAVVERLFLVCNELEKKNRQLLKYKKSTVKMAIRNNPKAFLPEEPCPCFSSKVVCRCCGKSVIRRRR